ncbi:MAG: hypothetical protein HYZ42_06220, partial [Bacteroidetes bacterium]|nr:hypothetical protein [Bacteroidota bacterium]
MKGLKNTIKKSIGFDKIWQQQKALIDSQKQLVGKLLSIENAKKETIGSFEEVEFSVFSQVGDDGIIQWLISKIPFPESAKSFIEFGVENYTEATTRFLLINNNWKGLVMDGSEQNVGFINQDLVSWMYDLTAKQVFITAENINTVISDAGFSGEIGLLHIDIDGNDYWVWKSISIVKPILVIMEYNSAMGNERAITIPYKPDFVASDAHFSRIYFGCSLLGLIHLANEKGYTLIGSNSSGNNAYFIRNDYNSILKQITKKPAYVKS